MKITARIKVRNQVWRHDTATGFLRCTAVILQAGIMQYAPNEVGAAHLGKPLVDMYVPPEAVGDPHSIQSLEGGPAVVGHVWQSITSNETEVGAIAGTPYFNGIDLVADIVVRDAETVRRIMLPPDDPDSLQEISSAWESLVTITPGKTDDGIPYDGKFANIRYNHVALLPAGHARGGGAVRIINEDKSMPAEFTAFRLPSGRTIRVHNEDTPEMAKEVDEGVEKAKNAIDPAKLTETMGLLETAKKELDAKQKEVDGYLGELKGLKEQLDALMGGDALEAAATEMNEQRQEAAAVVNAHGKTLTDDEKKLRGAALKVAVMNHVLPVKLTDEEAKNEQYVAGMYRAAVHVAGAKRPATPPAGHQIVNTAATTPAATTTKIDYNDPEVRRKLMYGHLVKA